MKLYLGKRQGGKTSLLIKKSMKTGAHIVVHNRRTGLTTYELAKQLYPDKILPDVYILNIDDLSNPTLSVCPRTPGANLGDYTIMYNQLLIDDYEVFCKTLMNKVIGYNTIIGAAASTNEQNWEIKYINEDTE